jgi:fibronectin-binding autotransporter adhesin
VTGTGKLVKSGGGTLVLAEINDYSGGTTVSDGTLRIDGVGTLPAGGTLSISSRATLDLSAAAADQTIGDLTGASGARIDLGARYLTAGTAASTTFAGTISGTGGLTKQGTGTLTLLGPNTFTGRTTIAQGTLVANADSIGRGVIENRSELVIDQVSNGAVAQVIEGAGSLVKQGAGRLNLTGTSPLTGTTFVRAGNLAVNGSLGSSLVNVEAGGTLSGTGAVKGINVARGGIIAPGNSIGTLNAAGNVTFGPGSFYDVEINGAGQSDRIAATGIATLNGGTVRLFADQGRYSLSPYTILTANGGVTGRFAGTEAGTDFAFVDPTLGYEDKAVTLTLVRKIDPEPPVPPTPDTPTPPAPTPVAFHSVAETPNQYNTADGVEALGAGNRLFDTVIGASAAGARQAFDALSGEAHASAATTAITDVLRVQDTIFSRLRNGPLAQAGVVPPSFDPRSFVLWGTGFGSWGKMRSDGNAASMGTSTGGFLLGAETQINDTYRLGIAGGFMSTSFDIDRRLSSGTNETVFGSIYGAAKWNAFNIRLGALYAHHDVDVNRTIAFPGFSDRVGSSYDGSTLMAFGEVGYELDLGGLTLEPFLGASVMRLHMDGFREDGGPATLVGYGRSYELGTTTLGLRAEAELGLDFPLTVHGMVGWRHAFGDVNPTALLAFSGAASAFDIAGIPINRDALVAEAGLDWQIGEDMTLGVSYAGQIGRRAQEHAVKANFSWRFETW